MGASACAPSGGAFAGRSKVKRESPSAQARLGLVDAERSALSAVLAWGVLFLSFRYDYGMLVLNAVLGIVVSFCNQL